MITRMVKVEIVGRRSLLDPTLEALYEVGVAHLEEVPMELSRGRVEVSSLSEAEQEEKRLLRETLSDLGEVMAALGLKEQFLYDEKAHLSAQELREKAHALKAEAGEIARQEREERERLALLQDYQNILQALLPLLEGKEGREFIGITLPKSEARILPLIRQEIEKLLEGEEVELLTAEMRGDRIAALLIVPEEKIPQIRELIYREGLNELRLPERYEKLSLPEALKAIEQEITAIPERLQALRKKLDAFRRAQEKEIFRTYSLARARFDILQAKERFLGRSQLAFLLRGWVPAREFPRLKKTLESAFGDGIYVEANPPRKPEYRQVPVKLENPGLFRPFQPLLQIFQPPIYGTVDPTPFLFLFFPILFGFMLGDVGYGAIGFSLFGFLWLRSPKGSLMRHVATIFLWCMGWSIFFGILYGEAFGDLGARLGMHPLVGFERTHEPMPILIAAIAAGAVQVLLGVALGVVNNIRTGHPKHALYEGVRFIGLLGLIITVLGIMGVLPKVLIWPGAIAFGGALIGVLFLHGIAAPLEIFSATGNMLSFARLMAVGLSSAILGMIANLFGSMIGAALFGITVALLFHALNTILGIFDPTVQGLRLQFVEFFSKFYQQGGRPYQPFRKGGRKDVA